MDGMSAPARTVETPVLFLLYNRPEPARRVLAAIRQARPARLFVAVDGPRPDRPGDDRACRECRDLVAGVDWDCQVHTLFQEENLGCKQAVASALDWFFGQEEEGVVLEDDCLPGPDFFPFCAELLARFRHDPRVMAVSGSNFQFGQGPREHSYYFSRQVHVWGWATWRRAWALYDRDMARWPGFRRSQRLFDVFGRRVSQAYWTRIMDETFDGRFQTWDYQWMLACWAENGLCVLPRENLVANIGFDPRATHTTEPTPYADLPTGSLAFPLDHPPDLVPDREADRRTETARLLFPTVDWLPGATLELVFGLRDQGRHQEALTALEELIGHFPGDLELVRTRGGLLAASGRRAEAVALFRELFAAHPDRHDLLLNACDALRHAGRLAEALAVCREIRAARPDLPGLALKEAQVLEALARTPRRPLA